VAENSVWIDKRQVWLRLEVVLPEAFLSPFMRQFGEHFSATITEGSRTFRTVDAYYSHPNGGRVRVTVGENEEKTFHKFLRVFCKDAAISLIDPRTTV